MSKNKIVAQPVKARRLGFYPLAGKTSYAHVNSHQGGSDYERRMPGTPSTLPPCPRRKSKKKSTTCAPQPNRVRLKNSAGDSLKQTKIAKYFVCESSS